MSKPMSKYIIATLAVIGLIGCGSHNNSHTNAHSSHSNMSKNTGEEIRTRPTNQVAVLTVWAESDNVEKTGLFYQDVLGLRTIGSGDGQYILGTDGSFLVVMEGKLEQPNNTKRRWPLFALTVADLEVSLVELRNAGVELPWGIETFGEPKPSSRYVMFYDPAGNLIELVEWL